MNYRWIVCLLALNSGALGIDFEYVDQNGRPLAPHSQEEVVATGTMDRLLQELNISLCDAQSKDLTWANLLEQSYGVKPCEALPKDLPRSVRIDLTQSGILSEKKANGAIATEGSRTIMALKVLGCDGISSTLRFTYDRVVYDDQTVCGFEIFIKKEGLPTVWGIAADDKGAILPSVPEKLAHDKHDNMEGNTIKSGEGCFKCHPGVSYDYTIRGATLFWGQDKRDSPFSQGFANGNNVNSHGTLR